MTLTAAMLLVLSACTHAGWNLLSKRSYPSPAMFLLASLASALYLLPVGIFYWQALPLIPLQVWGMLAVAGFFQAVYFSGLAGAYRSGDLSVAYPLARSLPVIFVAILTILMVRSNPFSPQYFAGLVLVVSGCLILPLESWSAFHLRSYWSPTCLLALVAAIGTTGYSLTDDAALRILRSQPDMPGSLPVTIIYSLFENLSAAFWLGLFTAVRPPLIRQELSFQARSRWRQALVMGFGITLAYTIVLFAMGFVSNVSYVVTFRQLSIPLGALMGILILHEPWRATKVTGVLCVFTGLILVGTG